MLDLKLESETTEIKFCFRDDMEAEGYFALEKGYYNPIKKNYGMILTGEKYIKIKSPIEGTIVYSGKNNLYIKSENGDFIKSEENSLIIAQTLSPTFFIAFDGLDTKLKAGDKIKSEQVLGESTQDFRISVLNSAEENKPYSPRNATDPCAPLDEAGFPGFKCDIIPSFIGTCK